MPHIFVSHASKDDDAVTKLHDALETATERELWVDHKDVRPPASSNRQVLDDALKAADAVLLVLSHNAVGRPEIDAEWNFAMSAKPPLPLYIAKIDDVTLREFNYRQGIVPWIDFTAAWDAGLAALIAAIKGDPLPASAPLLPARILTNFDLRLVAVPISGRDADLEQIRADLDSGRPTQILGIGGLGKSRLAAEMVVGYELVDGAVWHRCSETSRADELLVLLRQHFGLDPATERAEVLKQFRDKKRLLVIDNAESVPENDERRAGYAALINDLAAQGARVLLTSRVEWEDLHEPRKLVHPQRLIPEAAAEVVRDMVTTFEATPEVSAIADDFARAALYHAGLIDWSVRQTRKRPLDHVLNDLRTLRSKYIGNALDEMIHKTLRAMVSSEKNGEIAELVLRRLVVCKGGFTSFAAENICFTLPPSPLAKALESAVQVKQNGSEILEDSLITLQSWQFLHLENQRYALDPLAAVVLQPDPAAYKPHCDYYLALAEFHDQRQDYLGLATESENLDAAFEWAIANGDGEYALHLAYACLGFLANRGRYEHLKWFEQIVEVLIVHPNSMLRAHAQNTLGVIYQRQPDGMRHHNLFRSITAFEEALKYFTPQAAPLDYAMTQNNLGNAYSDLAQLEDRAANLGKAIAAYQAALQYRTPQAAPLDYATTQNNLGNGYRDLSELEDRAANLGKAVAAYQEAARFFTAEAAPGYYAILQKNLGLVYEDLGDLPAAIACWREAEIYFRRMERVDQADLMLEWIADAEQRLSASDLPDPEATD